MGDALGEARRGVMEALPRSCAGAEPLRAAYARLVAEHRVPTAENILDPHAWTIYVYYTALVARLAGRGARVLDWGGHHGQVTALLRAQGCDAANYLLHEPPHYALFRDAFALPTLRGKEPDVLDLPDASWDAALSSGVLEHVREEGGSEEAVVRELARVLRPGGWLFVWNLPTLFAPADLLGKARGRWHHGRRYREAEVRALLGGSGFEVLHVERHGGTPLGVALKALGVEPARAFAWDHRLARVPPFAWAAQNFAVAARKPS